MAKRVASLCLAWDLMELVERPRGLPALWFVQRPYGEKRRRTQAKMPPLYDET